MQSSDNSTGLPQISASSTEDGSDPRIGSVLAERYRIFSLLGEGGMGKVYVGEHVLMHKRVAVKVLHKELTNLTDVVKRFEREAMAAGTIDHPNVAGATDFGKLPDGSVFLVLEYVEGISLRSEIADGAFGLVRSLHVARQIASALAGAHARGIVHRDLKPENVMLVEKAGDPDFVKVLDFGIAKVPIQDTSERGSIRPGQIITKVGMVFGTPEYMAPEQALAQDVDGRADQYALGVILYEMLTGSRPFKSGTAVGMLGQQLQGLPPTIAERAPHLVIPPGVETLVARLLAADRDKRFDSCRDLVEAIENLLLSFQPAVLMRGSRPDASPGPLSPVDPSPSHREPWVGSLGTDVLQRSLGEQEVALGAQRPGWFEQFRTKLLPGHPRATSGGSGQLALALVGGLAIGAVAVVVGLWVFTSRSTSVRAAHSTAKPVETARSPAPSATVTSRAPEAELAMARGQGVDELERLAQRYPADYGVVVEIAKSQFNAGDCGASLGSVARALIVESRAKNNAEVATLLWKSVQKRECFESALKLLEGSMGTRGTDILYDLSTTPGVKKDVKVRAAEYFSSGRYEAQSSAALVALIRVRDANSCEERLKWIERAAVDADERALPVLSSFENREGCGLDKKDDCYPCLRSSDVLARAIEVLRRRSGK